MGTGLSHNDHTTCVIEGIMARNSGHYVRIGLGVVSAVYIDIQLWKFFS